MSTPAPAPRTYPFDARPLVDPVDPRAVQRFHEEFTRRFPGSGLGVVAIIVLVAVTAPMVIVAFAIVSAIVTGVLARAGGLFAVPVVTVIAMGVLAVGVWLLVRHVSRLTTVRRYRLDAFARANAMAYRPRLTDPSLPGMIFHRGSSRVAKDILRGEHPRFVEFANYEYSTGSGKNRRTHRWGYVAIHLGTPLPHIVLDAQGNNSVFGSNLPAQFAKAQRLSLEGDFDRHFALYCPEGYEADALYLFTPDVMARFVDNIAQLDVEIVDDWLFLYTGRPVSTTDPATWAWLFSAVGALMDKLAQWQRWRDERLASAPPASSVSRAAALGAGLPFAAGGPAGATPPPSVDWLGPKGVAREGRRLKRGIPWAAIVVVLIALGIFIAPQVLGVLGALFWR